MARDRLAEIAALRARGRGGGVGAWRGMGAIAALVENWQQHRSDMTPLPYLVIRLVTILEVFTREWVAQITDAGGCYTNRAAELVKGALKIDFVMAQALVGKQVTFGELISHDLSVNSVADIDSIFTSLLNQPVFSYLAERIDHWFADEDTPELPFMNDPTWTKAKLAQLFQTRHILVHELPINLDLPESLVGEYLQAASEFVRAANDGFTALVYGESVMPQNAAQVEAALRAESVGDELMFLLRNFDPDRRDARLHAVQAAWERYSRLQAEYRSEVDRSSSSLSSIVFATELERLTRARIEEVERLIDRRDGEL